MDREFTRLKTFGDEWPSAHIVSPERLTKAGFHYLGFKDYVQCSCCRIVLCDWKSDDNPLRRHIRGNPRCPFVLGREPKSDIFPRESTEDGRSGSSSRDDSIGRRLGTTVGNRTQLRGVDHGTYRPAHVVVPDVPKRISRLPHEKREDRECTKSPRSLATTDGRHFEARHAGMAGFLSRLNTLPKSDDLARKLARNGFFHSQDRDELICYLCGMTVADWGLLGCPDVLVDHETYSPKCPIPDLVREALIGVNSIYHASPSSSRPKLETAGDLSCVICFAAEREITFTDCGHFICCKRCADEVKEECPVCRSPVSGVMRTYLS